MDGLSRGGGKNETLKKEGGKKEGSGDVDVMNMHEEGKTGGPTHVRARVGD